MSINKESRTGKLSGAGVARAVALVGVMAATMECGKLALSFIPNVEIVTLLHAIYGFVFGWLGVAASLVFVCIEPMIYGFGSWWITYVLYWPAVAVLFCLLGRLGAIRIKDSGANVRTRIIATASAVVMTVWFGVLSSLVDVGLFSGYFDRFFVRFGIYYARGIVFYVIQVVTNAVLFPLLFVPLCRLLSRVNRFGKRKKASPEECLPVGLVMKKQCFFETAILLNERFGIVPLMYGSLGLEYITNENLNSDDVDILIPDAFVNEKWEKFKDALTESGYALIDEKEHTFQKNEICYSFASFEELESFAKINPSHVECKSDFGARFKVLSLEQYLKVYTASSRDGYRINVRKKKDEDKIAFILKHLKHTEK